MKHFILSCSIFFIANSCFAQSKDLLAFYDGNQQVCEKNVAQFLSATEKVNDSLWQVHYYSYRGPRIKTTSYKDAALTLLNGPTVLYTKNGSIDSMGSYSNGNLDSSFLYNPGGNWMVRKVYKNNEPIFIDSMLKKTDTVRIGDTTRPSFPGGRQAWGKYILHNLHTPEMEFIKRGVVIVDFTVNEAGETSVFKIRRSVNYWWDTEAIRVIRKSGKWIPARKDGHAITFETAQPIAFSIDE